VIAPFVLAALSLALAAEDGKAATPPTPPSPATAPRRAEPARIVREIDGGTIDWTTGTLTVTSKSQRQTGAWKDRRLQEQDALDRLQSLVTDAVKGLCVAKDLSGQDLVADRNDIAQRLQEGLDDWEVVETRYHGEGGVEMDAALDLAAWIRPALGHPHDDPGDTIGLVIDARGLAVEPCMAPVLLGVDGSGLWPVTVAPPLDGPVLFVSDPSDPRVAARVGTHPRTLRATAADGGGIVLDPSSVSALLSDGALATVRSAGRIAIVLDP
jgi:hypothetical protein